MRKLNKASGSDGGYAFGTLWQEATNGLGLIFNGITNAIGITEKTEQLRDAQDIGQRIDLAEKVLTKKKGISTTSIIGIVAIIFLGVIIFMALKKKNAI